MIIIKNFVVKLIWHHYDYQAKKFAVLPNFIYKYEDINIIGSIGTKKLNETSARKTKIKLCSFLIKFCNLTF